MFNELIEIAYYKFKLNSSIESFKNVVRFLEDFVINEFKNCSETEQNELIEKNAFIRLNITCDILKRYFSDNLDITYRFISYLEYLNLIHKAEDFSTNNYFYNVYINEAIAYLKFSEDLK